MFISGRFTHNHQLALGLCLLFALLITALTMGSNNLKALEQAEQNFTLGNQTAMDLLQLKDQLTRQRQEQLSMMLASSPAQKRALHFNINRRAQGIDLLLDDISHQVQNQPNFAEKLETLRRLRRASKQTRNTQVIPLIYAGKNQQAKALLFGIQQQRFDQIRHLAKELGHETQNHAKMQAAAVRRNSERSTLIFLVIIALFLGGTVALVFFMNATIPRQQN